MKLATGGMIQGGMIKADANINRLYWCILQWKEEWIPL